MKMTDDVKNDDKATTEKAIAYKNSGTLDRAVKPLRAALDRWHAATEQWVNATMELADELWRAREKFASNQAFGVWLAQNWLDDLGRDERAALINIGKHPQVSRDALTQINSRSPEYARKKFIAPRLLSEDSEDGFVERNEPYDPEAWKKQKHGVPEFAQEKIRPYASIIVRFRSQKDLDEFAALIGQELTKQTKHSVQRLGNSIPSPPKRI